MEVPVLGDFTLVRDVREDSSEEVIHEQKRKSTLLATETSMYKCSARQEELRRSFC